MDYTHYIYINSIEQHNDLANNYKHDYDDSASIYINDHNSHIDINKLYYR